MFNEEHIEEGVLRYLLNLTMEKPQVIFVGAVLAVNALGYTEWFEGYRSDKVVTIYLHYHLKVWQRFEEATEENI